MSIKVRKESYYKATKKIDIRFNLLLVLFVLFQSFSSTFFSIRLSGTSHKTAIATIMKIDNSLYINAKITAMA